VAFSSDATNLVGRDTNGAADVFVHDRVIGTTKRVSVSSTGAQANDDSVSGFAPAISADGRFVAFSSDATNLVPGDTNGQTDVFVRDRCLTNGVSVAGCTAKTQRVSVSSSGAQGNGGSSSPVLSAAGPVVASARATATTARVSVAAAGPQPNDRNDFPAISADGSVVAFVSTASNLVPDDTNVCGSFMTPGSCPDLFVRVRTMTTTPGPPTTGTTLPCTSSGCPVDPTPTGAACAGETI